MVTPKRRPAPPTGRARILLPMACVASGLVFGLVAGIIAGTIFGNVSEAYDLEVLSFGLVSGVLVCVAWIVWLCVRTGLGAAFGAATALLTVIGLIGWITIGYSEGRAVTVTAFAALVGLSWLTGPDHPRRWSTVVPVILGIVVLGAFQPAVDDLRTWRDDTKALTELMDPPLAPTAPGLEVREFRGLRRVEYEVAETGGPRFASVEHHRVKSRPAVSDDCFTKRLDELPVTGCAEVAPGVYRAEYVNDRSTPVYFLPRDNTVVIVRDYTTGETTSRYGDTGAGDELMLRLATSLRPTSVQDLARQGCYLCRLMPK